MKMEKSRQVGQAFKTITYPVKTSNQLKLKSSCSTVNLYESSSTASDREPSPQYKLKLQHSHFDMTASTDASFSARTSLGFP